MMLRNLSLVCAGAVLAVSIGAGCSKKAEDASAGAAKDKPAASAPAPAATSVTYKAPDGSFTIDVPVKMKDVKVQSQKVSPEPNAPSMSTYTAGSEQDGIMYVVAVMPTGGVQESVLDNALENSLKGMSAGGEIVKQSNITLAGKKALHARVKKTEGANSMFMEWEVVFIDNAMYQISVMTNDEKKLDTPEAKAFLSTFKYTGAPKQ